MSKDPSELRGRLRRGACDAVHGSVQNCDCWKGFDCPDSAPLDRMIDRILEAAASEYDRAAAVAREDRARNTRRPDGQAYVIYSEQENRCKLVAAELRQMKL